MAITPVAIGGMTTLTSLLATMFVTIGRAKGWHNINIKWHSRLAMLTLVLALLHGTGGLLISLGYI